VKGAGVGTIFPGVPGAIGRDVYAFEPSQFIKSEFITRALEHTVADVKRQAAGDIPGLSKDHILRHEIGLPPRKEQGRIIAKIQELLQAVNASRDHLAKVLKILKAFRQSVLAAACSFRLTEDWRDKHPNTIPARNLLTQKLDRTRKKKRAGRLWGAGVVPDLTDEERDLIPETWAWTEVRNLNDDSDETVQVGPMSMRSRDFTGKGVPVLNVGCVQWGYFDESRLDHLPEKIAASFERYKIRENDVLFTRSGTVGRCAIAETGQNGYLMTFHLLRARTSQNRCLPHYLQFALRGAPNIRRQTEEAAIGSTRAGFNTNLLANLNVPLAPRRTARNRPPG